MFICIEVFIVLVLADHKSCIKCHGDILEGKKVGYSKRSSITFLTDFLCICISNPMSKLKTS